ncbi:S8 family peptidase [Umezawaea sp.]|uniref:S8 family peptidase n=1 Tax=Umezawaea sp. TaxID=1955258 RepID=UPI002ED5A0B1
MLATALVTAQLLVPQQRAASASAAPGAPPGATASHRVTLLTGDVVDYAEQTDGTRTAQVDAAPRENGPPPAFRTTTTADGLLVVPEDAQARIDSGALDPDLFNVTRLVAEGLEDGRATTIPVITAYAGDLGAAALDARAADLPAERRTTVASAGAVGMRVAKDSAPAFWRTLTAAPESASTLDRGVAAVSLDRRVHVTLDRTTRQVGAPAAWEKGLDGTGTTVAVVDTGIDAGHPDLAGAVVDSANFTDEPDVVDRHGHGTHVASIVAGTGAASGGRYRGVAPGAKLLVAKVFDSTGYGETSQVMAGMEWAAERGAEVVNLSLGAGVTDGSDPLSALVDDLSRRTGALFVVAAGNSGPGDRTVTTPGTAASALTVGAVDRDNRIAGFSGRGPRSGDAMVKPEVVAPGVDVVAARAADTAMGAPVDDRHTAASGTSMATPHVAGAAAILHQQHPDWTGSVLKDALVSSARDVGLAWFQQGSGLLDVARAVEQTAIGPPVLNFGRNDRVAQGTPPVPRTLEYTNPGDEPLTLGLSLSAKAWTGETAPAGSLRLASTTVVVPAKGKAATSLVLDPDEGEAGVYGGEVVASDGATVLRTPVSTYNAPELFKVDVRVLDSAGRPAVRAGVQLVDDSAGAASLNDPFRESVDRQVGLVDGVGSAAVPAGTYSAIGWSSEKGVTTRTWSALHKSEVDVRGPTSVTLDARGTVPVGVVAPTPVDQRDRTVMLRRVLPATGGTPGHLSETGLAAGATSWRVRATPSPATKRGAISLQDSATLQRAAVELAVGGASGPLLHPEYDAGVVATRWPGQHDVPLVFGGLGTPEEIARANVAGKAVLVRVPVPPGAADPVNAVFTAATAAAGTASAAGAVAVVSYVDVDGALTVPGLASAVVPHLSLDHAEGAALRARTDRGPTSLSIRVHAAPDAVYHLAHLDPNGVPSNHLHRLDRSRMVASKAFYHAEKPGLTVQKTWYPFATGLWKTQIAQPVRYSAPASWTEYTGPADERVVWKRVVTLSGTDDKNRRAALAVLQQNVYRAGETSRPDEHWFGGPMRGTAVELAPDHPARYPATEAGWKLLCTACRGGEDPDLFVPALQWGDGTPGHYANPYENAAHFATTRTRVFQGDEEVVAVNAGDPLAVFPLYRLSPTPTTYRLEVVEEQKAQAQVGAPSGVLFRLAPRTDTTWTFRSQRPAAGAPQGFACRDDGRVCAFQPLVRLDLRLPLDLGNQAPAGGAYSFDVVAGSHSGAVGGGPVVSLRTAYSTDEGATWRDAVASPRGDGRWTVTVVHPALAATSGYVWLRTTARDSAGNTVTSTVRRAYALTAPAGVAVSPAAR